MITKTDFDAKLSSLNRKISEDKTDHLLVQNELNKLKTVDSSYFIGKNYFENDGMQHYLVFQSIDKYLKFNPRTGLLSEWESEKDCLIKLLNLLILVLPQDQDLIIMGKGILYLEGTV